MEARITSAPPAPRRVDLSDEEGAQAVEYAMIGGLGAGAIGLLWTILKSTGVFDRVVDALLSSLVELITCWF